jgi:FG-GAP-like repeat/WD40-like Beta Propeller Repeat
MNMYQPKKQIVSAISILFFALYLGSTAVSAQILKPGELIYSRAITAPSGSNCDTAAIWAVGQDGSNDRFITNGFHPRISPDGRRIMFKRSAPSSSCAPFSTSLLWWIRDLATRQETQISTNGSNNRGHYFSPETNRGGNQIIFDDNQGICRMNLDGTNRACILATPPVPRQWGHMGVRGGDNKVVMSFYDSNFQAVSGLSTFAYDNPLPVKLANTAFGDINPSWSNDGQSIAFTTFSTTAARFPYVFDNFFKINPDGTNRTQLTFFTQPNFEGFSYSSVWSADNTIIYNAAKLNGVSGIYKISANGGGVIGRVPISAGAEPEWVGGIAPVYSEQQVTSWGGGNSTSGNYSLVDTIGQAFAGQTSTGGNYNLQSGFWTNNASTGGKYVDFDGDGKTDISVFRPSVGEWYYQRSSNSVVNGATFGSSTDKIVPSDYTGDGKTDIAIFRPSTGFWFVLRSEDFSFYAFPYGVSTDIPTPGDFDGDGKADAAVFRPSTGIWYISKSSGGDIAQPFGTSGDRPVVGDYDGDGKSDIAIFRPSVGEWYALKSGGGVIGAAFGAGTDKTVQGDYTGDGKADFAFYRPSTGFWWVLRSEDFSFYASPFGAATDTPTPGDYDGDGKFDQAVFRPSTGIWYINKSNGSGVTIQPFGAVTDIPAPSYYLP